MLELAPVPKEIADDSKCDIPENLDGYSGDLEKDNGSATDQIPSQPCGELDMPLSSGPPNLSLGEEIEENEAHDSCIEDSTVVKRPSLTSIDSGVVIEAEDLVSRLHTSDVEIELSDKASSPQVECDGIADETAVLLSSAPEDIVSWTLTSDYDENKPVSAP